MVDLHAFLASNDRLEAQEETVLPPAAGHKCEQARWEGDQR